MCDDPGPDGPFQNGDAEDSGLSEEELQELARELFGPDPFLFGHDSERDADEERCPTPGERVLYALGQLHRLRLAGRLPVEPSAFAIEDVARIVGVADELEFISDDRGGTSYHFPNEVLHVNLEWTPLNGHLGACDASRSPC